jgi:hypothetical protein
MNATRLSLLVTVLVLFIGVVAAGQEGQNAAPSQLYLLAATPDQDWGYPAILYRVDGGKLGVVREVVPQTDGVRSVLAWGGAIFLVRGHIPQPLSDVIVVHTDNPQRIDEVPISGFFINPYELLLAQPHPPAVDELLAISPQPPSPDEFLADPQKYVNFQIVVNLSIVSSDPAASPREHHDDWTEYEALRSEGAPGGLSNSQIVFVEVTDDTIVIDNNSLPHIDNSLAHQMVRIDSLAHSVRDAAMATAMHRFIVVAADEQYLLLKTQYNFEELKSGKAGKSHQVFVHDRLADRWTTIQLEGTSNSSRSRFFAPWLATIVADFNMDNAKTGPGRENERGQEAFGNSSEIAGQSGNPGNARFPLVRGAVDGGTSTFLPGVLLLDNVKDGRRIRIETGQEDSEILQVRNDTVLYRVNDTIYQAAIQGSQLQGVSVVAKDEDVPEIHWVFWSK